MLTSQLKTYRFKNEKKAKLETTFSKNAANLLKIACPKQLETAANEVY